MFFLMKRTYDTGEYRKKEAPITDLNFSYSMHGFCNLLPKNKLLKDC